MSVVERYPVIGAGLAEFASRHRQRIQSQTPVDRDTHTLHLRTDHARVQPQIVTHADRSVDTRRDMRRDVGKQRRPLHHRGCDPVDPGWADVTRRIDQRVEFIDDGAVTVQRDDRDLHDAVLVVLRFPPKSGQGLCDLLGRVK
jgi:hypothetical protein